MITCTACHTDKQSSEFYKSANGLRRQCKACVLAANKRWRESNPELARRKNREANKRYLNSPAGKTAARKKNAKKYGLTLEEYDTLLSKNGGVCPICTIRPATHIDHCHKTGEVRGALCLGCNAALGAFNDSVEALERAKKYLAAVSPLPDKE